MTPPTRSRAPCRRRTHPQEQYARRRRGVRASQRRAPARRAQPANTIGAVIERDEVLAVARLARLALNDDELEPMARELSSLLEHIAKIAQLDLDDVAPTSHVVDVSGALRADKPRPSWPRELMLSQAPAVSDNGFLVPSPQA